MAGFEVSINGRIWVSTEEQFRHTKSGDRLIDIRDCLEHIRNECATISNATLEADKAAIALSKSESTPGPTK